MTRYLSGSHELQKDVDVVRRRVRQIYTFLRALVQQRFPALRQISDHPFALSLRDLPDHESVSFNGCQNENDEPILEVKRPKLNLCPRPADELRRWLHEGWDNPRNVPSTREQLPNGEDDEGNLRYEKFEDNHRRLDGFNQWVRLREVWAEERRRADKAQKLFEQLYEQFAIMEKEGGQLELVVGDGLLNWRVPTGGVNHPIILKRVELKFDDRLPAFRLINSDRPVEIYNALLVALDGVDLKLIQDRVEELKSAQYHPLLGYELDAFLKALVQSLSPKDGEWLSKPDTGERNYPRMWRDPYVFARRRNTSYSSAIEQILRHIETTAEFPQSLAAICGVHDIGARAHKHQLPELEDRGARDDGSNVLLAKPANAAQVAIIKRLDRTGRVHVQGPPGTGKTHTIGNVIGHLLAQGKRILVTSHTEKALRVLKEQVPKPLQSLCVSVLSGDVESRRQLENAINEINNKLTRHDPEQLLDRAKNLVKQRDSLLLEEKRIQGTLRDVLDAEYVPIEIDGRDISPSDAAREVAAKRADNDWIPGSAFIGKPYPITSTEMITLYASNGQISSADELELDHGLPDINIIPSPEVFSLLVSDYRELLSSNLDEHREYWLNNGGLYSDLESVANQLFAEFDESRTKHTWRRAAIIAGKQGGQSLMLWTTLCDRIERTLNLASELTLLRHLEPSFVEDIDFERTVEVCQQIETHLSTGGNLGIVTLLMKGDWKQMIRSCRVTAGKPSRVEHFKAIRLEAQLRIARSETCHLWNQLIEYNGGTKFESLGEQPESSCYAIVPEIQRCLEWSENTWSPLLTQLSEQGLNWSLLESRTPKQESPLADYIQIEDIVTKSFPDVVRMELMRRRMKEIESELARISDLFAATQGGLACQLFSAIQARDSEAYAQVHSRVVQLQTLKTVYEKRDALLKKLESVQPEWAAAIRGRVSPHDGTQPPGNLEDAWRWLRLASEIKRRQSEDLAALQIKLEKTREQIRKTTVELIDNLAWAKQIKIVRSQPALQQSLAGWLDYQKRLSSARIKTVQQKLRMAAQRELATCSYAVPVWIMSLQEVAEKFNPNTVQFDVVIIDEASQANLMALIPLYMAKEAIIVGDHEQTTPEPVGIEQEPIQNLIDVHLQGIPHAELFDLLTSIYDLAKRSFGETIMLTEHFRCVPDIIGFSNALSYNGQIKPLREEASTQIKPPTVAYRVNGIGVKKKNDGEAEAIVRLISAMTKHPTYESASIGVISMLGDEQAKLIDMKLRAELPAHEYIKRRIVCGSSAQFQGDERDVVMLSMVDSVGEEEGFLRRKGDGSYGANKKRFNVAASRAKDQLWVIHSMNPHTHLKPNDIRRDLIMYAQNPKASMQAIQTEKAKAESVFELKVMEMIAQQGYRVKAQWPVGYYRIDLVVFGKTQRLAIECDGDRFHGPEKRDEDLERQAVLERLGWRFVRIRGTSFFLDPVSAMQPVYDKLEEMAIERLAQEDKTETNVEVTLVAELEKLAWPEGQASISSQGIIKAVENHEKEADSDNPDHTTTKTVYQSETKERSVVKEAKQAGYKATSSNTLKQRPGVVIDKVSIDQESFPIKQVTDVNSINASPGTPNEKGSTVSVKKGPTKEPQKISRMRLLEIDASCDGNPVLFVQSIPKDTWFRLARWAKEHNFYQGWERKIVYNIGAYLKTVSEKQAQQGMRIITEAVQKGFE